MDRPGTEYRVGSGETSRRIMFVQAFAIAFLVHLLLFSIAPMVSPVMREMNLSHTQFGLAFSMSMVSLIIFRLPWGLVADRKGYVAVMRVSLLLATVAALLRAVVQDYTGLLVSQFLLGFGLAATLPGLSLMVKEWALGRPGLGTGTYIAGFATGNASALGVTPLLLNAMHWREVFLLYAGFGGIVSITWWLLGRSERPVEFGVRLEDVRMLVRDKHVWLLLCLLAASMGCYDTLANWMPRVLEMKQTNPSLASLLPVGFFFAGPVVGFMADRLPSRRSLVGMLGLLAVAAVACIALGPLLLLIPALVLAGFATTGCLVISLTVPVEHHRLSPYAGTVVGLISSVGNVGPLAMPVLFGFLIDVTATYYASLASVAILAAIAFVGGSRAIPR